MTAVEHEPFVTYDQSFGDVLGRTARHRRASARLRAGLARRGGPHQRRRGANHEPGSFDPQRPHHIRAFDVVGNRLVNGRLSEVVGAIGTSGETPDEDESVSLAGAAAPLQTLKMLELTYDGAQAVAYTIADEATVRGVSPVAAIVDSGGELVYLWRRDRAQVASVGVATDKARTAAIYRRPSKDFEEQAPNGRASVLHLARAVPLQGGIPIVVDGQIVGAVGVSGASSADEGQLRAAATTGGTPHSLAEGDVLAIPEGVPHQFTDVSDPFHYFVVKVEA